MPISGQHALQATAPKFKRADRKKFQDGTAGPEGRTTRVALNDAAPRHADQDPLRRTGRADPGNVHAKMIG
jgi:hypothetical protein